MPLVSVKDKLKGYVSVKTGAKLLKMHPKTLAKIIERDGLVTEGRKSIRIIHLTELNKIKAKQKE